MSTVHVDRHHHVKAFVALHHVQQKRKYTGEPYLFHLVNVAEMAAKYVKFGYEIGLCHDLLEDTACTEDELHEALIRFGYDHSESMLILGSVIELTDIYTHEAFPKLNRAIRKVKEARRLYYISSVSQTVKYCDLIDNTSSIVKHDKGFAIKYLQEKEFILSGMTKGNHGAFIRCLNSLRKAQCELLNP